MSKHDARRLLFREHHHHVALDGHRVPGGRLDGLPPRRPAAVPFGLQDLDLVFRQRFIQRQDLQTEHARVGQREVSVLNRARAMPVSTSIASGGDGLGLAQGDEMRLLLSRRTAGRSSEAAWPCPCASAAHWIFHSLPSCQTRAIFTASLFFPAIWTDQPGVAPSPSFCNSNLGLPLATVSPPSN